MNDNLFSAVTLDGKELNNLSAEQIKNLFFQHQINQNSLVRQMETQKWQMLKRVFDVTQWTSAESPPVSTESVHRNQFAPLDPPNTAENSQSSSQLNFLPPNDFSASSSNTHAPHSQNRFGFQTRFQPDKYDFANNFQAANSGERTGARQAAIFLCINAVFIVILLIVGSMTGSDTDNAAGRFGRAPVLALIIDLLLASRLWKNHNIESTRRWVLVRCYFGLAIFGLIVPALEFSGGDFVGAILSIITAFFYFFSLAVVLHGKADPTPHRVMIGVGTFAVYFLFVIGLIGFSLIAAVAPGLGNFGSPDRAALEQYKIAGTNFEDPQSGARISLPEGWTMLDVDNPVAGSPEARMVAVDRQARSLTMLEVVPVPADADLQTAQKNKLLENLTDYVAKNISELNTAKTFAASNFREITRMSVYVGKRPAKLLVFEKTINREKVKGHLIITFDKSSLYILHSWCPAREYERAQNDFLFFERSFTLPEPSAAPFPQSAEAEKNSSAAPKNF